ncbi:MCE family protein [Flavobacterium sp. MAH-1]|uniref:MCE family protein n=1 Tax=Flavobacterium agri TaxID=2743471 RepID=A0A7Y8XZU3_9FLAO|nr:MlaD family protein [Flavobacterium agri]NUY79976.1 MCE family protein [Flavobacterium agri]NYA70001.1 MCE family protein [Flavobacterium agri]
MKITREIKTAILVIASILLFIWGYSFLKGTDILNSNKVFYVQYDNVEGLMQSAPVTINGMVVGKVTKIRLHPKTNKPVVEFQITNEEVEIAKSSQINLYEPGLIAGKQIQIIPNLTDTNFAVSGDTLTGGSVPGLTALVGDKLSPITAKLDKVLLGLDGTITSINNILDKKSQENLKNTIAELNATMAQFHKASNSLNGILDNNKGKIDNVVSNFEKVSSDFNKISSDLEKAELDKAVESLKTTLTKVDNLMAQIDSGKGTMGKLIKDDALYDNLAKTSRELELLLQDVRLNPTRYINVSLFGKKNKPYVAPTEETPPK